MTRHRVPCAHCGTPHARERVSGTALCVACDRRAWEIAFERVRGLGGEERRAALNDFWRHNAGALAALAEREGVAV